MNIEYLKYYYCAECDLKFAELPLKKSYEINRSEFKKHMREKHGNENDSVKGHKVLKCHFCFLKFPVEESYEKHVLRHETEESLCPECGKVFKNGLERKRYMDRHRKRESGTRKGASRQCVI